MLAIMPHRGCPRHHSRPQRKEEDSHQSLCQENQKYQEIFAMIFLIFLFLNNDYNNRNIKGFQ